MKLKILDTGYISPSTALGSQTQLSDADRAGYTGSEVVAITMDVASLSRQRAVHTENKAVIELLSDSDTSLVSVGNRMFKVSLIKKKELVTVDWDVNDYVQLMRLETTRGLKLLYPDETSTALTTIVEAEGAENTGGVFSSATPDEKDGTVSTTTPYMIGRVKNIAVADDPSGNYWRISFDFEVTS